MIALCPQTGRRRKRGAIVPLPGQPSGVPCRGASVPGAARRGSCSHHCPGPEVSRLRQGHGLASWGWRGFGKQRSVSVEKTDLFTDSVSGAAKWGCCSCLGPDAKISCLCRGQD